MPCPGCFQAQHRRAPSSTRAQLHEPRRAQSTMAGGNPSHRLLRNQDVVPAPSRTALGGPPPRCPGRKSMKMSHWQQLSASQYTKGVAAKSCRDTWCVYMGLSAATGLEPGCQRACSDALKWREWEPGTCPGEAECLSPVAGGICLAHTHTSMHAHTQPLYIFPLMCLRPAQPERLVCVPSRSICSALLWLNLGHGAAAASALSGCQSGFFLS